MECQICFCGGDEEVYRCKHCDKIMCHPCISEYIKHTTLLLCSCNNPISPCDLPGDLNNIKIYKIAVLKQIEMKNFNEIKYYKDYTAVIEKLRNERQKKIKTFPKCIKFTVETCYAKEMNAISKTYSNKLKEANGLLKKVNYANICSNNWCDGQLEGPDCVKCKALHCLECKTVVKTSEEHVCKEEDLASVKFIESQLFKCPNCSLSIQKSSGCSHITCAGCGTKFDHNSGETGTGGGHSTPVKIKEVRSLSDIWKGKIPRNSVAKIIRLEKIVHKEPSVENIVKAFNSDLEDRAIYLYFLFLEEKKEHEKYLGILKGITEINEKEELENALNEIRV